MGVPAIVSVVGIPIARAVGSRIVDAIKGSPRQALINEQGSTLGGGLLNRPVGPATGQMFVPGADIDILSQGFAPGTKFEVDAATGEIKVLKRRRRRKRLLTCGDKADIAFLTGTLGKGQLAQGAITSLLSKCG